MDNNVTTLVESILNDYDLKVNKQELMNITIPFLFCLKYIKV